MNSQLFRTIVKQNVNVRILKILLFALFSSREINFKCQIINLASFRKISDLKIHLQKCHPITIKQMSKMNRVGEMREVFCWVKQISISQLKITLIRILTVLYMHINH